MQDDHNPSPGVFEGKVAIVSGGSSGIGLETCKRLTLGGATVICADIAPCPLTSATRFEVLDVTDREAWQAVVDAAAFEFGGIDILVNCAGVLREGNLANTTLDAWRQLIAVNVEGTFYGCQSAIPHMNRGGAIVNLASVSGSRGDANLLAYTTSKCAVTILTKEIALDCARRGLDIRCNCVSPGVVDTGMIRNFFDAGPAATLDEWIASQPVRRAIDPGEVADLILFLAGSDSSYMTGSNLAIDCGATA